MNNFASNSLITSVLAPASAGQGTAESSGVDMAGYFNVAFLVNVATLTAGGTFTLSLEARDSADDSWQALEGSVTVESAGVVVLECENPSRRFVRAVVVRADQNSSHEGVLGIQRRPGQAPVVRAGYTYATLVSPEPA